MRPIASLNPSVPSKEEARPSAFGNRRTWVVYITLLIVYLLPRVLSWKNATVLEDHDSVRYLAQTKTFLTLKFTDSINSLGVDCTVVYPFFSALFSLPGWPVEAGARL